MFVGWDWASTTHDVTVIDDAGKIVDRWAPEHTELGLEATLARLTRHGPPEQLPVAIERPSGLVVDRLLAAGHPVIPIHPNAFHAARPRWGAAAAKSDPGDSFKLADYLRTDGHRLRRLRPLDAATRELQALVAAARRPCGRQDRGQQPARRAAGRPLARRQAGLLPARLPDRPGVPGRLSDPGVGSPPRRGPPGRRSAGGTPTAAAAALPSCSGGCGRRQRHRSVLLPRCSPSWWAPRSELLRTLLATIADLDRATGGRAARAMPRPGCWPRSHASARSAWPRSWPRSARSWTAPAPPSTPRPRAAPHRSPKRQARPRRSPSAWAANTKARNALATFAGNSRHSSPWAAKLYADARRRGKHHPHAVRILGPRLAAGHVGLLAQRHHLRPRQARRRTAPRRPNLTQETQAHRCPPAVPAAGAHRHQPAQQLTHDGASPGGLRGQLSSRPAGSMPCRGTCRA